MSYKCNRCDGEVRWDPNVASHQCGDPDCDDCGMGRWLHVGKDCHGLVWAVGNDDERADAQ